MLVYRRQAVSRVHTRETLDQDVRRAQLVRARVLLDQRGIAASNGGLATGRRSPSQRRVGVSHGDLCFVVGVQEAVITSAVLCLYRAATEVGSVGRIKWRSRSATTRALANAQLRKAACMRTNSTLHQHAS